MLGNTIHYNENDTEKHNRAFHSEGEITEERKVKYRRWTLTCEIAGKLNIVVGDYLTNSFNNKELEVIFLFI
jgi:hypothetical protein